jgi:4-aminobutyrate aminotransferase/4-aminobutyrate aminotransferase/(S)-3-amino-2-methylpropionate transaminase
VPADHAGPAELLRLKSEYLLPCVYPFFRNPPQIVRGEGSYLFDHEGKRYLDCVTGVTVMSAGHCNPQIIEPAIEQIRTLGHTTSIFLTEPVLRLAEKLAQITPGEPGAAAKLKRSFFCASGSEAVEGALLLATLHTHRREVIALTNGLHGRTKAAMSATGLAMWRTDPFPLATIHHVPFGDTHALADAMSRLGGRVAAVIGEPIQGNGGINIPPDDYWPAARRLTSAHGALLILDEIQTGFNRTGRRFACEHWGVVPDVLVMSKAIANGFPIAAFITTDAIAQAYTRPGASTYGGNPVCAAAALATIDFHERHDLAAHAAEHGKHLLRELHALAAMFPFLASPRGRGLMLAVDVVLPGGGADPARCDRIIESLKDRGVLIAKTGPQRNALTLLPPLTITPAEIGELIHALQQTLGNIT